MHTVYDALVLGTGIAGLTAAISLKKSGLNVLVVTKEQEIEESNTRYAQGGIIARKEGDTPEQLASDIIEAGSFYSSRNAVKLLAEEGPPLVFDFLVREAGVQFNQTRSGGVHYTGEAAHSIRRIAHIADHTGDEIEKSLISLARQLGVEILGNYTAVDIITNNHHSRDCQEIYKDRLIMGVYALNNRTGEVETFLSANVILATGGVGNLYKYTSNPPGACGDGISMAYRTGASIINAEFVQFHPTCLYHRDIKRFLISESLRGEGARLQDPHGHPFIQRYTDKKEMDSRDVVARAIYGEMRNQGSAYMMLNLADYYRGSTPIEKRFSSIYKTCISGGIDITREPIPIVPAAHYFCGGIRVDENGRSNISGLYAVGEVSCTGLHGANRLASSSLLEGLLWGKRAAEYLALHPGKISLKRYKEIPDWELPSMCTDFEPALIKQDLSMIKALMWNYVGIVRTTYGLERALSDLNYHSHRIFNFYKEAKLTREIVELRNAIVTAQIIVKAASHNKKSLGCHYLEK